MVNGVIYTGSVVPLPTKAPSRYSSDDAKRARRPDRAPSYSVGYQPFDLNPPITSHHYNRQERVPVAPSARWRPQLLAPPPVNMPQRYSPVSHRPPNGLPQTHLDKDLLSPPPTPEAEPTDRNLDHRAANPEYLELHLGDHIPDPPLRAELEERQPPPAMFQPNPLHPTRLSTRSYLTRYGGLQHLAELDAGTDAQEEQEDFKNSTEFQQKPPVLPEIAFDTTISMFDERQPPVAKWYDFYKGARTWDFEDLEEAYRRLMAGSSPRSSGSG